MSHRVWPMPKKHAGAKRPKPKKQKGPKPIKKKMITQSPALANKLPRHIQPGKNQNYNWGH